MPFGTDYPYSVLSPQNVFDAAAFIDSQPRPHRLGAERDFPSVRASPAARSIRRSSARSRHRSI
jgi:cytochrome c